MSGKYRRNNNKGTGKKILILIFVLISLFCIIFFAARGRFKVPVAQQVVSVVLTPFQGAISWVGSQLNYVTSNIWELATMHEQNKMLRNEVEQLRIQNLHASEYDAENQRLRALLHAQRVQLVPELRGADHLGDVPDGPVLVEQEAVVVHLAAAHHFTPDTKRYSRSSSV